MDRRDLEQRVKKRIEVVAAAERHVKNPPGGTRTANGARLPPAAAMNAGADGGAKAHGGTAACDVDPAFGPGTPGARKDFISA